MFLGISRQLGAALACPLQTATNSAVAPTLICSLSSSSTAAARPPELFDSYADLIVRLRASHGLESLADITTEFSSDNDLSVVSTEEVDTLDEKAEEAIPGYSSTELSDLLALRSRLLSHQPQSALLRSCETQTIAKLETFEPSALATTLLSLGNFSYFHARPLLLDNVQSRVVERARDFSASDILDLLHGFSRLSLGRQTEHESRPIVQPRDANFDAFFGACEERLLQIIDELVVDDLIDAFVSFRLHGRSMNPKLVQQLQKLQEQKLAEQGIDASLSMSA